MLENTIPSESVKPNGHTVPQEKKSIWYEPFAGDTALTYDDVLLVPQYSDIETRKAVDISTVLHPKLKLEIPILPANMDTVMMAEMAIATAKVGSIGIIHRFLTLEDHVAEIKKVVEAGFRVGAAIGVKEGEKERAQAVLAAGATFLSMDIAHAHSKMAGEMVKYLKSITDVPIMAGTVVTPEGIEFLAEAGADIIKFGIGAGAVCTTRIVTGSGFPQLSAVMNCAKTAKDLGKPLVADGGIYTSGAIVKALAAGASAVMFGKLFAGTDEAPGEVVEVNGKKYKSYRGMASREANQARADSNMSKSFVPEGVSAMVPYTGPVEDLFNNLIGGIKSGLSYSGAHNITELQVKAKFVRISNSTIVENWPHEVIMK